MIATIELDVEDLDEIGEDDGPGGTSAVLLGTVQFCGVSYYAQGYRIAEMDGPQQPLQRSDEFFAINAALEGDRKPWQTIEIADREYVFILAPFCR